MDDDNKNKGNVIGLVPQQDRARRFKLTIHYQDGTVESAEGDYFGVSMENSDCFMVGRTAGDDVIPIGFYYLPMTKKIKVDEVDVEKSD